MPSHTVALSDSQYQYILATKEDSVSQRVRELVDKGIDVEEDND